ncbi:integrase catalytic domain-containing protein [Trichonephila clavipes]|nr:integrase catalytic domain-containing protein [Trichonephila clavipes]
MEVNDQKNICLGISRINDFRVLQKLATHNIFISDSSANNKLCLFEKHSDEILILLGSDIVGKLFTGKVKQLSEGLTAVNTRLGWTVMGKLSCGSKFKLDNSLLVHSLFTNREKISDLRELDSLGIKDPSEKKLKLELQDLALKHFENTVLRDDEGRYIVSIPWIEGNEKLEDHCSLAKGRLEKTVKNLKFTGRLFDYEQVFVNWEKEGIIEKIAREEPKIGGKFHYLPHRPVFKKNSTTKIRSVFDGKNRSLISDIRKAFLHISLRENDMNFLRFLWWEGGNSEKAVIYRHRRVVFGVSCSPFLLAAVLNHSFKQAPEHLEKAAEKLKDSMYVDNCVASGDFSKEESFQRDSTELLALGFTYPITLITELLIEKCWKVETSWNSKLQIDIEIKFEKWKNQLIERQDPKIPRRLSKLDFKDMNQSLQVFCDVSKSSYARQDFRLPITLPSNHPVVKALIIYKHVQLGHAGVQMLIYTLRESYWILKRRTIKEVIKTCIICKRFNAKPISVSEGLLPQDRVRDAAVFETIGLDLAGPLILKTGEKNWILILTCAVYRGIHLELLTSISIESFLLGLRRFIARRGRLFVIYSDNGTNFKGAYRLYQKVNLEKLKNVELNPIPCKFIPPQAPWPLTYVTNDIEDLEPLTPAMFLQGIREAGVPEFDQTRITKGENTLSEGDIVCVLVGDDHTKRLNWNLDHELSKPQRAANFSMQPCSSISNGGAGLEPRAEISGHQQAETSSMQTCSSVSDVEAGVEPRLETLELPVVLTSDGELQQPGPR